MMMPVPRLPAGFALFALVVAGCTAGPAGAPTPQVPPSYAALPDTLVCVVDRAAPTGLHELPAKRDGDEIVVLSGGNVVPLESLHPINVIAGYAGREEWMTRGDPIQFQGRQYSNIGGERRVGIELLERIGDHRGILLFSGRQDDPPPDALYIPTAPGCVFQPFVRDDLIRR